MHRVFYALYCGITRAFLAAFVRRRVRHAERMPRRGGFILAPNHISHFDPPLLSISLPRKIDWMAMRELFARRSTALIFRLIDTFPVDRRGLDRGAVKAALARLRAGRVVGLFPEGGLRTGAESVLEGAPIRPGAAALAQMTGTPIVPCVIIGSDALYAPRQWLPLRRTRVWIAVGEPISVSGEAPDKQTARAEAEAALGRALRALYAETVEACRLPPGCLPQTPQRRKGQE